MKVSELKLNSSYRGKKEPYRIRTIIKIRNGWVWYADSKYPLSSPFNDTFAFKVVKHD